MTPAETLLVSLALNASESANTTISPDEAMALCAHCASLQARLNALAEIIDDRKTA